METLNENEHPLVTPDFVGTDAEKTGVLGYWSDMIGKLRSLNVSVISHRNKLAIIAQLKKELDLIDVEINNDTAHPIIHKDGSNEMSTMPKGEEVPVVAPVVDLTQSEVPVTATNPYDIFNPKRVPASEAMQRLAGNWYPPKK